MDPTMFKSDRFHNAPVSQGSSKKVNQTLVHQELKPGQGQFGIQYLPPGEIQTFGSEARTTIANFGNKPIPVQVQHLQQSVRERLPSGGSSIRSIDTHSVCQSVECDGLKTNVDSREGLVHKDATSHEDHTRLIQAPVNNGNHTLVHVSQAKNIPANPSNDCATTIEGDTCTANTSHGISTDGPSFGGKPPVVMFKWGSTGNRFRCQVCDMSFKTGELLKAHFVKHESFKPATPYSCNVCRKSFRSVTSFQRHKRMHMGVTMKKCRYCHKAFANRENLDKHMENHGNLIMCRLCECVFSCKFNLETHVATHQNLRQFVCTICNKGFNRKDTLNRHENTHANRRDRKFECVECGKRYMTGYMLKRHMRAIHSGEASGIKCEICGKFILYRENLKRHMLTHSGQRNFKCEVCGFAFTQKAHLNEHKLQHEPEKQNYKCSKCGCVLKSRRSLNYHLSVHRGPQGKELEQRKAAKCIKCILCGESFQSRKLLNEHMSDEHTKMAKCNICFETVKEVAITKHIRMHESKGELANIKKGYTELISKGTNTDVDLQELETDGDSVEKKIKPKDRNSLSLLNNHDTCKLETMVLKDESKTEESMEDTNEAKSSASHSVLMHAGYPKPFMRTNSSIESRGIQTQRVNNSGEKLEGKTPVELENSDVDVGVEELGEVVYYLYEDDHDYQGPIVVRESKDDGDDDDKNESIKDKIEAFSIIGSGTSSEGQQNLMVVTDESNIENKSNKLLQIVQPPESINQESWTMTNTCSKVNDFGNFSDVIKHGTKSVQIQASVGNLNEPKVKRMDPKVLNEPQVREVEQTYVIHIQDNEGPVDLTDKNELLQSIIDYATSIQ